MIDIEAIGGRKKLREEVEDATFFFLKKLLPRIKTIEINIILKRGLKEKEGLYGDCIWEDKNHRPRVFTIRMDSAVEHDLIMDTLAHEMVHVKQYARGELVDCVRKAGYSRWKGKFYPWNGKAEPWEKEPWKRSKKLYEEWKSYK
jgi:hypothetical protein